MKEVLVFAILCVALAAGMKLENICSTDSFKYDGVLVNAFHRITQNVTFRPFSHFLINDTVNCDPTEFKKYDRFWQVLKLKHE